MLKRVLKLRIISLYQTHCPYSPIIKFVGKAKKDSSELLVFTVLVHTHSKVIPCSTSQSRAKILEKRERKTTRPPSRLRLMRLQRRASPPIQILFRTFAPSSPLFNDSLFSLSVNKPASLENSDKDCVRPAERRERRPFAIGKCKCRHQ